MAWYSEEHRQRLGRIRDLKEKGFSLATIRRLLQHRNPFAGDEDHIHHRLELHGAGPRGLLAIIYALAMLFSTLIIGTPEMPVPRSITWARIVSWPVIRPAVALPT